MKYLYNIGGYDVVLASAPDPFGGVADVQPGEVVGVPDNCEWGSPSLIELDSADPRVVAYVATLPASEDAPKASEANPEGDTKEEKTEVPTPKKSSTPKTGGDSSAKGSGTAAASSK